MSSYDAYYGNRGVRPLCTLKSSILVSLAVYKLYYRYQRLKQEFQRYIEKCEGGNHL